MVTQGKKILFVCMGNICRSPAGEGIMKQYSKKYPLLDLHIESCGLGDWHKGQLPDERMQKAAQARGYALTSRAQQIKQEHLDEFDYILAADHEVLNHLKKNAKDEEQREKIILMTHYSSAYRLKEVPDPYEKDETGFELVMDILEDACEGLVDHIKSTTQK